jgi:hypothetical protein
MTNLKARRENDKQEYDSLRFSNSGTSGIDLHLPSPSPHHKLLNNLLPIPSGFSTTEATLSIMTGTNQNNVTLPAPFQLPSTTPRTSSSYHLAIEPTSKLDSHSHSHWNTVTIAPILNQNQQNLVPVLPVLEPPVDSMSRIRDTMTVMHSSPANSITTTPPSWKW